jgi:hypothetical protein
MQKQCLPAILVLLLFALPAKASILLFLDDLDEQKAASKVAEQEPVKAEGRQLKALGEKLLKLKRPEIVKLLGGAGVQPPKAYAMPLAEGRAIGLSGLRRADDDRPDEHFIQFHAIGDYAAVQVFYARTESGDDPVAVRFYLRVDDKFERLNDENFGKRLAWEWEGINKLTKYLDEKEKKMK